MTENNSNEFMSLNNQSAIISDIIHLKIMMSNYVMNIKFEYNITLFFLIPKKTF